MLDAQMVFFESCGTFQAFGFHTRLKR